MWGWRQDPVVESVPTLLSDTKDFSRRKIHLFDSLVSYKPFLFEFGQQGVGLASTEPTYLIKVVL